MNNIILAYRVNYGRKNRPVETYARSFHWALEQAKWNVIPVGEGHEHLTIFDLPEKVVKQSVLFLDIDCGRNSDGKLSFQLQEKRAPIPSALRAIDTHGYPSYHHRAAKNYDHVFFAVHSKRDCFSFHPSAHWAPNSSDPRWFDGFVHHPNPDMPPHTIGFFGSKGGIDRADIIKRVCDANVSYTCDVREIGRQGKARWPRTALAMANCFMFFNKGQKHDGPNQRVIESMLMAKPLITDKDPADGMSLLFEEGKHYLGRESEAELMRQMGWVIDNKLSSAKMAQAAYTEVKEKHLVKHRVAQILEVCLK